MEPESSAPPLVPESENSNAIPETATQDAETLDDAPDDSPLEIPSSSPKQEDTPQQQLPQTDPAPASASISNDQGVDGSKSAARIRELNAIDEDITKSLQAAADAIKALTNAPTTTTDASTSESDSANPPLDAAKAAFETHTSAYYTNVQSVFARLRRQIYALEEAGIIAPNQASTEHAAAAPQAPAPKPGAAPAARTTGARTGTTAAVMQQQRAEAPMEITNGGLGGLDVGWLNSRGDRVGRQMEAELWAQAKELLGKLKRERGIVAGTDGVDEGEGAEINDGMDVDKAEP